VLTLSVPIDPVESYNEATEEFVIVATKFFTLELEHSLVSLSKWESFFHKPFLGSEDKTTEEIVWYVQAMSLTPNVPPEIFQNFSQENVDQINAYIEDKMTATFFSESKSPPSMQIITAELIYYWLIAHNISWECQYWHLNRLLTLVKVCNRMNEPQKKMSPDEIRARNRELNNQRLKELGTKG
jgi:hypothetical protein